MLSLTKSWSDISVAVLDPEKWKFPVDHVKPVVGVEAQIVSTHLQKAEVALISNALLEQRDPSGIQHHQV